MYCSKCGRQLPDKAGYCAFCGSAITASDINKKQEPFLQPQGQSSTTPPMDAGIHRQEPLYGMPPSKDTSLARPVFSAPPKAERRKIGKKARMAILLSTCTVVVLAAAVLFGIPAIVEAGRASSYEDAVTLMKEGSYGEAKEVFAGLGDYQDAVELTAECQNIIDYTAGETLMDEGKYQEAKAAFEALASYGDAKAKSIECKNALDYGAAMDVLSSGDYEQAQAMFIRLGSYKDSALRAEECGSEIAYMEAVALMDKGRYSDARAKLEPLAALGFGDSSERLAECNLNIDYGAADTAFNEGRFYTAFKLFAALNDFRDSAVRAANCEQDYPSTGEIYRNNAFSGSAVTLKIKTPGDDPRPTLLKIYTADGTHVSSLFIHGGKSPSIKLPASTYMIKSAYGEKWYGPEEMFGDESAVYQTLLLEGGTTYAFERNYTYTLTLRSATDGNVGTKNEDRSGF